MVPIRWLVTVLLMTGLALTSAGSALCQTFPNKPVRMITGGLGGGADFTARLLAQQISGPLGQEVVIENRGGSAIIAAQTVSKAPPDGYTLLLYGSNIWLLPFLQDNVPYDPVRDFSPITLAANSPNVIVVFPGVPANSVKELIALAKANPGTLNYGSVGSGGSSHLATELFKSMAGVNIVRIPYKDTAQAMNDLISGQVQVIFAPAGGATQQVKSGRLRALAVTSAKPSALVPGLPTVSDSGLPGYESTSTYGIFAPAGTPAARVSGLNKEIVRALAEPSVKEKLFVMGVEAAGSSPEEFAAMVKAEMSRMGKVIKDAGIRLD